MFKLATPSFIIPDTRINNARYLENQVDEVELLYFESKTDEDAPDPIEVEDLKQLDLTYNIHMPIDRDLDQPENWPQLFQYADTLSPLQPTTYTFHPGHSIDYIDNLLQFANTFGPVSVENVNKQLDIFQTLSGAPISFCFDIGHAILYDINPYTFLSKWGDTVSHIHFHGVADGKDHRSLSHLDKSLLTDIIQFAHEKNKTLCLEMFNKQYFFDSISILRRICDENSYTDYRWCR